MLSPALFVFEPSSFFIEFVLPSSFFIEFVFDAPFEQIRLVHQARDRRVFAEGALHAARWLIGRKGVFTTHDVVMSSRSP